MPESFDLIIHNRSAPGNTPINARRCTSFFCKLRGLTFRKQLPPNWGLLFEYKKDSRADTSIHMLWMHIDLAIIWINSDRRVVDIQIAKRWRSFLTPKSPAKYVLETSPDYKERFRIGDEVEIEKISTL